MISWLRSHYIALVVAIFAMLPLGVLISIALDADQIFYPGHYVVFLNTILVAAATAFISICIGVPIALITTYLDFPFRKLWLVILLTPLAIPSYIGAFALYSAFGRGGELDAFIPFKPPALEGIFGTLLVL